ncbi:MAG: hypothetical protein H0T71_11810 [Acidobacteria bacterium]|nr:hypothetical protein [Acidobacteriota bacterium]
MTSRPTYDDANLILRLYEMRREERMRKARAWFTGNFKVKSWDELQQLAPGGSDENASYRMVVTYWDMVASFVSSGVLHQELFFQSGRELLLVWERLRDVLPEIRRQYKDPHLWGHLEAVGNDFAEHFKGRSDDAYDAFLTRIGAAARK